MPWIALILENIFHTQNVSSKCFKNFLEAFEVKNFHQKNFLRKNLKRNFVENFSGFTKTFGSKSVETFFQNRLKNFLTVL